MKIILLGATFRKSDELLFHAAQEQGHEISYINPNDVILSVVDDEINIDRLARADRVLIRRTAEQSTQIASIAVALESLNVPCMEKTFHYTSSSVSKTNAILKRAKQVKVPSSWAVWSLSQLERLYSTNSIEFPLLFKPDQGFGGQGIKKFLDFDELQLFAMSFFQKTNHTSPLLMQKEVKRKREYRVLVLNGEAIGTVIKCVAQSDIVANSIAGNKFVDARISRNSVHEEEVLSVEESAVEAAKIHKLVFTGVDVIVSEQDEKYIIECNRNPQFVETQRVLPNVNIASKVIRCLENYHSWEV